MSTLFFFLLGQAFALGAGDAWFPADYDSSRARFRASCAEMRPRIDGYCRSFSIPSRKFEDLSVDAAYFGRGGRRLLVMVSGTHGPESPAGAAVQEFALRRHLESLLDAGVDVLMVHALDPFGFKTGRRVDENNVNLNRNFMRDAKGYAKGNDGYDKLRAIFAPDYPVGFEWLEYLKTDRRLLWQLVLERGNKRPISEGMNAGQYNDANGLNYGGAGPTPQVEILRDLLTPLLQTHERVLFVDWHTGLGDKYTLHWIASDASSKQFIEDLKPTFARLAPVGVRTTIVAEDPDFFRTTGGVEEFAASLATAQVEVMGVTAEFGTMGTSRFAPGSVVHGLVALVAQLRSAHRLIVENQAWFQGCRRDSSCARVREDFAELFNPRDSTWRESVITQADHVLSALTSDFGSLKSPRK